MVLTYGKYIELLSALDEHCKGTLEKRDLQDAIFNHYTSLHGSFVAENINTSKRLFAIKLQKEGNNKKECKKFRNFMNEERKMKSNKLNKLKICQK